MRQTESAKSCETREGERTHLEVDELAQVRLLVALGIVAPGAADKDEVLDVLGLLADLEDLLDEVELVLRAAARRAERQRRTARSSSDGTTRGTHLARRRNEAQRVDAEVLELGVVERVGGHRLDAVLVEDVLGVGPGLAEREADDLGEPALERRVRQEELDERRARVAVDGRDGDDPVRLARAGRLRVGLGRAVLGGVRVGGALLLSRHGEL